MDPGFVGAEQWTQLGRLVNLLYALAGLAMDGAVAFLLARAILPSLHGTGELPVGALGFRRVFYPLFGLALLLAVATLWRALTLAGLLQGQLLPRWAI